MAEMGPDGEPIVRATIRQASKETIARYLAPRQKEAPAPVVPPLRDALDVEVGGPAPPPPNIFGKGKARIEGSSVWPDAPPPPTPPQKGRPPVARKGPPGGNGRNIVDPSSVWPDSQQPMAAAKQQAMPQRQQQPAPAAPAAPAAFPPRDQAARPMAGAAPPAPVLKVNNAYGAPTSVHVGLGVPAKQPPAAAANFRPGEYNFASSFASRFAAPADAKPSVFGRR